ncbi:hypothetical protein G3A43_41820 [Paraburkholderia aspalathi]|uniref:hypothetical protein n=1 Tax=Paraburkholderia nemoris TaxID=2793076 RepID=UPI00190CFB69|nr:MULTISPECIES: hypothetical protein [Paraburkholderia]MBK3786727.1 hypothetical protein [Paraburkholderia aspalathi]
MRIEQARFGGHILNSENGAIMSDTHLFRVSIDLRVSDSRSLFDAALRHATELGSLMSRDDALNALTADDGSIDVPACLAVLLDPDAPLPGTDIEEATIASL